MAKRPDALTPAQAADWLEALPPVAIKTELVDFLRWQATKGQALGHMGQYIRRLHFGYAPREETEARRMATVREIGRGIGRTIK